MFRTIPLFGAIAALSMFLVGGTASADNFQSMTKDGLKALHQQTQAEISVAQTDVQDKKERLNTILQNGNRNPNDINNMKQEVKRAERDLQNARNKAAQIRAEFAKRK
jgi:septal ring factor EnvC (AmiA/AmiB activator)